MIRVLGKSEVYNDMVYENELYHYGVLGMKWGHRKYRNRDGSLNKLARDKLSNYKNLSSREKKKMRSLMANDYNNDAARLMYSNVKISTKNNLFNPQTIDPYPRQIANRNNKVKSKVEPFVKARKDLENEIDKFNSNEKLRDKWSKIHAEKVIKSKNNYGWTMDQIDDISYAYSCGDYDQDHEVFKTYAKSNKSIQNKINAYRAAENAYDNACKDAVDSVLGEYGNIPIKDINKRIKIDIPIREYANRTQFSNSKVMRIDI